MKNQQQKSGSGVGVSQLGTSYDFNKLKKGLNSVTNNQKGTTGRNSSQRSSKGATIT